MITTLRNIVLIAANEMQRTLVTRRGLISLSAFALVWLLLLLVIIQRAPALIANGTTIGSMLQSESIMSLSQWRIPEFGAYWIIALYLFPLCSVFFSADQTATDRARGTLKLLSLHTTRTSLFFGRFFGVMLVQGVIIALALLSTLVIAMIREPGVLAESLQNILFIWVNLLIVIAPYTALMAVISLIAKTGMQAINYAAILWILFFFAVYWISNKFPQAVVLKSFFPGSQISDLARFNNWQSLSTALAPAVQTLVLLAGGWLLIHRIDL